MKTLLLTSLICLVFFASYGQNKKVSAKKKAERHVYDSVEKPPEPVGGLGDLTRLISRNLKFPNTCADYAGKIIVNFVIEPDGSIDNKTVMRDPSGDKHLFADQVFKIIESVKWKPGRLNGKPVATWYALPLTICLGSDD
ncbi:energy transducer TonB [Mucilaginibacter ginsenosidivorax]|uniref:energy transducer TonB n=1 Tax=Mucilaginibacter ginsenosidivorax TaxID=862126 RepID=UPI00131595EA|nr:energy transducer TonB [Mucilaginibacter ginsenosidivorax]